MYTVCTVHIFIRHILRNQKNFCYICIQVHINKLFLVFFCICYYFYTCLNFIIFICMVDENSTLIHFILSIKLYIHAIAYVTVTVFHTFLNFIIFICMVNEIPNLIHFILLIKFNIFKILAHHPLEDLLLPIFSKFNKFYCINQILHIQNYDLLPLGRFVSTSIFQS